VGVVLMLSVTTTTMGQANYSEAIKAIEQVIEQELQRGIIKGVSIALVDDQTVVHARGYGLAQIDPARPASERTIYRVGSISKVLNALAVAQLVDAGKLDLDAPITKYDPSFHINSSFDDAGPITLRQLLCHRSGIVRESPVGSYFDPTEPSIAAAVASLAQCALVEPPNTRTRYSNIGPTVAGRVIEVVTGQPYNDYVKKALLEPMGMTTAQFSRPNSDAVATGYMAIAQPDGSFKFDQPAPTFELATAPAGNLYASALDLAQLAKLVFADGRIDGKQVISSKMLAEACSVQLTGEAVGFGLGFHVGTFADQRSLGHNGAVYGFSSAFIALPESKIAVIVLINEDVASGPQNRLVHHALHQMLNVKTGRPIPQPAPTIALDERLADAFVGEYESQSYWASIQRDDQGQLHAIVSGQPFTLRPVDKLRFEADGRFAHAAPVEVVQDDQGNVIAFNALGQRFNRVNPRTVQPLPAAWRKFLGVYGESFIPQIVRERNGHLYAMTENMYDYRMRPLNPTVFHMPPGLYAYEQTVFQLDEQGNVHGIIMSNVWMPRRDR